MTCLASSYGLRPRHQASAAGISFVTHNRFEKEVAARAVAYTTVCFMGRGQYDRRDYETYAEALAGATAHQMACGKGVLLYAVCDRGFTALLATLPRPTNWRREGRR